jgi:hypothetical protein
MTTYKVEVTRDDRWWMIRVPDIDGLTQARRINEIEEMARSLIAISTDVPLGDVDVKICNINVSGLGDIAGQAGYVRTLRDRAAEAESRAMKEASDYARALSKAGIPVRDIAELLSVSPQRINQLAKTR